MQLTSYSNPEEFLARSQTYLDRDQVRNSLILGIALTLEQGSEFYQGRPYLAIVEEAGQVELVALMTPPHNLLLCGGEDGAPQRIKLVVEHLMAHGWPVPGVLAPTPLADAFSMEWHQWTQTPVHEAMDQRVYALRSVLSAHGGPGYLRPARSSDVPVVAAWIEAFHAEITPGRVGIDARETAIRRIRDGTIHLWEDEHPVSMAGSSRPTSDGITIGLVYTPPVERGCGYATSCVATLSQQLLDGGFSTVTLFADLANPTSNAIYQRIGFRPVADFREYRFGSEGTQR